MTEETTAVADDAAAGEKQAVQFATQRIYMKDASFEAPNGLAVGGKAWQPKVNQDLSTSVNAVQDGLFEVVLNITIQVKVEDDKTAFLVEVHQAGLFAVSGLEGPQLQHLLSAQCPQILFPYAREAIDNFVVRGGFPPLMLPPINFDALFAKAVSEAQTQAASEEGAH